MDKAIHALVSGRVQGVGYRQTARSVARSMGLVGWVRNLPDGQVELNAQGSSEDVDSFVDWLWTGPAWAQVSGVEADVIAVDSQLSDFLIQPDQRR